MNRLHLWHLTLKNKLRRWWYRVFYGVDISYKGTMPAEFGKDKYVSVERRGPYVEITSHHQDNGVPAGKIRLIPYQPNHGLMVEFHDEKGQICWRTHCDYDKLYHMGDSAKEQK